MICHENLHRYEWPLGKVTRIFHDPSGIVRTAEAEEGGRRSLCPVTFLVPLELHCHDEEDGNTNKHEREGDNSEPATSETKECPFIKEEEEEEEESALSGHNSPITLGVDSSMGPQ